ncbi:MAG: glutaredoxin 3 [Gammaproteobacteria bacterium]|nr:glutaredoxin 3 [Gammaproteobacteria bacterium]
MANIEIYCSGFCGYCLMAEKLLESKGAKYKVLRVDNDSKLFEEMISRSQRRTVPQIFIDDKHIGGYTDIAQLDKEGGLDPLLAE